MNKAGASQPSFPYEWWVIDTCWQYFAAMFTGVIWKRKKMKFVSFLSTRISKFDAHKHKSVLQVQFDSPEIWLWI